MASSGNVSKLKINNADPYDIKDALARKVIDSTNGDSETNIIADIVAAVGDSPTNYETIDDVVKALAKLNIKARGAVADVNLTKDNSTKLVSVSVTRVDGTTDDPYALTLPSKDYVDEKFLGASHFMGVVNSYAGITVPYNAGDYWVVGTAGTYAGQENVEAGDFIYATTAKASGETKANSDFKIVQANINPDIYAQKAGGTSASPQTFSGYNSFSNPVTVATPTANGHAATKKYVDDAVAGDKIHDYVFISDSISSTSTGEFDGANTTYDSIVAAYAANKVPIINLSLASITGEVPVVMLKSTSSATEFYGSAFIRKDTGALFLIGIRSYISSNTKYTKINVRTPITSVTPTTGSVPSAALVYGSYANETLQFVNATTTTVVTGVSAS